MTNSPDKFGAVKGFVNRNLVLIVMVPMLITLHWGWFTLQKNPNLVDQSNRKNPFDIVMKNIKNKWGDKKADEKDS
ncbi:uncharacterized protein LOC123307197 [Coccinella septempunctata]|uniref:uncharacterized protein LOC123307197 n=1 Tax=Coccinella septempunctata TaxID=41139 RepID=UPI001D06DA09|nr:uncharacterized protein LOC123307197 [Coccinella septempunctata]